MEDKHEEEYETLKIGIDWRAKRLKQEHDLAMKNLDEVNCHASIIKNFSF